MTERAEGEKRLRLSLGSNQDPLTVMRDGV